MLPKEEEEDKEDEVVEEAVVSDQNRRFFLFFFVVARKKSAAGVGKAEGGCGTMRSTLWLALEEGREGGRSAGSDTW